MVHIFPEAPHLLSSLIFKPRQSEQCVWEAQFCDFTAVALGIDSFNRKEFVIYERPTP